MQNGFIKIALLRRELTYELCEVCLWAFTMKYSQIHSLTEMALCLPLCSSIRDSAYLFVRTYSQNYYIYYSNDTPLEYFCSKMTFRL